MYCLYYLPAVLYCTMSYLKYCIGAPKRCARRGPEHPSIISAFRGVLLEDVVFDNNILSLILYLDVT